MKYIILLLLLTGCNEATSNLTIDFIDVGQGDATLIQQDEYSILIDCGQPETNLINFLNNNLNESTIDLLIATHPDWDHIGGCPSVYNNFKVETTWHPGINKYTKTYKEFKQVAYNLNKVKKGENIKLKDIKLTILSPENIYESANDNSLVSLIEFSNFQMLIMGDCEHECENNIYQEADVLRVGHHGSNSSSSEDFVTTVDPYISIISVGENDYGHPHQEALNNFQNTQVLRTDKVGTITIEVEKDGKFYVL